MRYKIGKKILEIVKKEEAAAKKMVDDEEIRFFLNAQKQISIGKVFYVSVQQLFRDKLNKTIMEEAIVGRPIITLPIYLKIV